MCQFLFFLPFFFCFAHFLFLSSMPRFGYAWGGVEEWPIRGSEFSYWQVGSLMIIMYIFLDILFKSDFSLIFCVVSLYSEYFYFIFTSNEIFFLLEKKHLQFFADEFSTRIFRFSAISLRQIQESCRVAVGILNDLIQYDSMQGEDVQLKVTVHPGNLAYDLSLLGTWISVKNVWCKWFYFRTIYRFFRIEAAERHFEDVPTSGKKYWKYSTEKSLSDSALIRTLTVIYALERRLSSEQVIRFWRTAL